MGPAVWSSVSLHDEVNFSGLDVSSGPLWFCLAMLDAWFLLVVCILVELATTPHPGIQLPGVMPSDLSLLGFEVDIN